MWFRTPQGDRRCINSTRHFVIGIGLALLGSTAAAQTAGRPTQPSKKPTPAAADTSRGSATGARQDSVPRAALGAPQRANATPPDGESKADSTVKAAIREGAKEGAKEAVKEILLKQASDSARRTGAGASAEPRAAAAAGINQAARPAAESATGGGATAPKPAAQRDTAQRTPTDSAAAAAAAAAAQRKSSKSRKLGQILKTVIQVVVP